MRQNPLLLLSLFFLLSLLSPANGQPGVNPMVHQQGFLVVDGQNRPLRLRSVGAAPWLHWEGYLLGSSLLTKQSHIIDRLEKLLGQQDTAQAVEQITDALLTEDDVRQMAADGFNCVRVPLNYRCFEPPNATGFARLDNLIGWCSKYHVYVVLDLHDAPGGQSILPTADPQGPLLFQSLERQNQTVELWHRLAERYKNSAVIAGYDILNEPSPKNAQQLIALYQRIIDAIRSVDPNHMIIVEGVKMASDFEPFTHPLCNNMAYSFHIYTWFGDNRRKKLSEYAEVAHSQKVPMWVGEYGENKLPMIDSTLQMFAQQDYIAGWSFWPWKRCKATYPDINIIDAPPSWRELMTWVARPLKRQPTRGQTLTAISDFERSASITNTQPNQALIDILRRY